MWGRGENLKSTYRYNVCLEIFVQRGKAMAHPKLDKIEKMLEKGKDFELSNEQYKTRTGADFPKSRYYAEKKFCCSKEGKRIWVLHRSYTATYIV